MRIAVAALAAAFFCLPAAAVDRVAQHGDDEVRISESPCVHAETLARISPELRAEFQKADGRFNGQRFFGCWRPQGNVVHLVWEDGDQGIVPFREMRPVPDI